MNRWKAAKSCWMHTQREDTKQILYNSSPETEHPAACPAEEQGCVNIQM